MIKVNPDLVSVNEVIGKTSWGEPVVYIKTHGGFHCLFTKSEDGKPKTLATAPHPAVLAFLAEKADPKIQWDTPLTKSEDADEEQFNQIRDVLFTPKIKQSLEKKESSDSYFIYDVENQIIDIVDKNEMDKRLSKKEIKFDMIIRSLNLTDEPSVAGLHPDFTHHFKA